MQIEYPRPETYEKEYTYWPWGQLINTAINLIIEIAPANGLVLDYMCGTGYLLGRIASKRADLRLVGCSLWPDYIKYGINKYPGVQLVHANALTFASTETTDVTVCTGGLHHLRPDERELFLKKITGEIRAGGWLILGEEVLSPYNDETARRMNVLELYRDLLQYSVCSNAPAEVLEAGLDLLRADLFQIGEYKLTEAEISDLIQRYIPIASVERIWPASESCSYGDRLFLCGPQPAGLERTQQ